MNRDPLYRKIEEALAGPLDGNTFEECAAALIGEAHPNLAPMPGGSDAGMDGAFGTPDGSYPLVCTVQLDVIGNFRRNITTYLAKRSGPKRAVVATSQLLSNRQKRNLDAAAAELGVTIVNTYDAAYFADKLYRNSSWRLRLLNITGDPPALSVLPRVGRFAESDILVGRDDDLAWLKQADGDALLVGQPGSGKTYLHQRLASQNFCLFAVDDSPERLANAIRERSPSVIVVDDAHIHTQLVETLKRLRAELGAVYNVHVNCWPNSEPTIQRILDIPDKRVRRLRPLSRNDIFEIIKRLGIIGPDWLQNLLISQSDGKPGLAVALAEICKIEDAARIWSGEAAAKQLLGNLRLVRGEREKCVLASFAVGGDAGMSFGPVSDALGLSPLELREITAGLGSGGLVQEVEGERLAVRPAAIQAVLVRDAFFEGPIPQQIGPLLVGTSSVASTVSVLLSARQRGAKIAHSLLEELVVAANSRAIWEHFAWVDEQCAATILNNHAAHICDAAPGLLNYFPKRALNALLDADDEWVLQQRGATGIPRRSISDWLFPAEGLGYVTVERRDILLDVLEDRARQANAGNVASFAWALAEVLQAVVDVHRPSPGNVREIRHARRVASDSVFEEIVGLWPRVKELFRRVSDKNVKNFFNQIESWCLPQRFSFPTPISTEAFGIMKRHGRTMLSDVLEMPNSNRAWRTWASELAKWAQLDLQIEVDPMFDALYARRDSAIDWKSEQEKRSSELRRIGDGLAGRPIDQVLRFLTDIRSEATVFGHRDRSLYLWIVYQQIAKNCQSPREWLSALMVQDADGEFLIHFVDRLFLENPDEIEAILTRLLQCPNYRPVAIHRALRLQAPSDALLTMALDLLVDSKLTDQLWLHGPAISEPVMARLFANPSALVRAKTAIAEWNYEPSGTVRPGLEAQWRVAIPSVDSEEFALVAIFEKHPDLAFGWLRSQIELGGLRFPIPDEAFQVACDVLDKEQRIELLRMLTRDNYSDECFDLIVGEHIDLFAIWLQEQRDPYLRLLPLDRDCGPRWEQMAILAADAGVSPDELASHCMPNGWTLIEPFSQFYLARIPAYEALAIHPDRRLRPAGKRGLSIMQCHAMDEVDRERREQVYGE